MWFNLALWVATGLYVVQTIAFLWTGNKPQAVMMGAYAVANLGIIWSLPNG